MPLRLLLLFLLAGLPAAHPAVAASDPPSVVTPDHVTLAMLRIANVGPRDYLIDLGSGEGLLGITAAKRFGARVLGVDMIRERVQRSRENARAASIAHKTEFREQDIFKTDLAQASVITMHLAPAANLHLRPALLRLKPGTRVVSHGTDMGEWRPDRVLTVAVPDGGIGHQKLSRVYLWTVPARVQGIWCGRDRFAGVHLQIAQSFQDIDGRLLHKGGAPLFKGSFKGASLQAGKGGDGRVDFELEDGVLVLKRGGGAFKPFRGARFERGAC